MRLPKLLKKPSACLHKHQVIIFVRHMKKILAILLVLAACIGCASQSSLKKQDNVSFEYNALTRGRNLKINVTDKVIQCDEMVSGESIEQTLVTTQKDWNELIEIADKINLDKLMELQPPSKKHQYDGAMAASVTITVGNATYRSATFDHGNPPAEIAALVNKLTTLGGKE